jgi:hypothetical protein
MTITPSSSSSLSQAAVGFGAGVRAGDRVGLGRGFVVGVLVGPDAVAAPSDPAGRMIAGRGGGGSGRLTSAPTTEPPAGSRSTSTSTTFHADIAEVWRSSVARG